MINRFISFLTFEKRYSPHTIEAYRRDIAQLKQYNKDFFQLDDLASASHNEIRAWVIQMMDKNLESSSINRKMSSVKTYYNFLLREEIITKDPTSKIKKIKSKKKIPQFIPENSLQKKLQEYTGTLNKEKHSLDSFHACRNLFCIELLYNTGIRLSEAVKLSHSNISIPKSQIKVLGKGNKERIIPLSNSMANTLTIYLLKKENEFKEKNPTLIVTDKGKKTYAMHIQSIVKDFLHQEKSVKQKSPHTLRHSFATHLLNNGADLNAIKELLGHASLAATQIYTHNSIEKLKNAFDQAHPKAK